MATIDVGKQDSGESWVHFRRSNSPRYQFFKFVCVWAPLLFLIFYTAMTLLPAYKNLLVARQRLIDSQQKSLASLPELESKMAALAEQLRLLTTSSIEARLNTIETTLHVADVKPEQIASLEDTRKEFDILKSYMFADPKGLVELKQLQTDYRALREQANLLATKEDVKNQISSLNNLWFLSLGFFGIIISMLVVPKLFSRSTTIPTKPISSPPEEEKAK